MVGGIGRNPRSCFFRANLDVACFKEEGRTGFGCVITDINEAVVAIFILKMECYMDPKLVEITCIRKVLSWFKNLQVDGVDIFLDSLVSVQAILKDTVSCSCWNS